MTETSLVPVERVERTILMLRGHRVILDSDLAALYGVPVKRLNERVRRNLSRFPPDSAFQFSSEEFDSLISQFATSNARQGRGGPFALLLPVRTRTDFDLPQANSRA